MELDQISKYVKCCACGGSLADVPCTVQIPVLVTWNTPKWGNFLTGAQNQGVAFICDLCAAKDINYTDIKSVVEFFSGNSVKYHSITWVKGPNNRLTAQLT